MSGRRKIILRQAWTITPISTSCLCNNWGYEYHSWLPHWFEQHVIVRLLYKLHRRHCARVT